MSIELDLRELLPPLPLVRTRQALYGLESGESVTVIAAYPEFLEGLARLEEHGVLKVASHEQVDGASKVEIIKP